MATCLSPPTSASTTQKASGNGSSFCDGNVGKSNGEPPPQDEFGGNGIRKYYEGRIHGRTPVEELSAS